MASLRRIKTEVRHEQTNHVFFSCQHVFTQELWKPREELPIGLFPCHVARRKIRLDLDERIAIISMNYAIDQALQAEVVKRNDTCFSQAHTKLGGAKNGRNPRENIRFNKQIQVLAGADVLSIGFSNCVRSVKGATTWCVRDRGEESLSSRLRYFEFYQQILCQRFEGEGRGLPVDFAHVDGVGDDVQRFAEQGDAERGSRVFELIASCG